MGGLRKYMPITWITSLLGTLALVGTPFFSGFYSKESIIEAVRLADIPGSGIAYAAVLSGVFITAFYSFRMYFLVFHGEERFAVRPPPTAMPTTNTARIMLMTTMGMPDEPHEFPAVVTIPLIFLAVPSVLSAW